MTLKEPLISLCKCFSCFLQWLWPPKVQLRLLMISEIFVINNSVLQVYFCERLSLTCVFLSLATEIILYHDHLMVRGLHEFKRRHRRVRFSFQPQSFNRHLGLFGMARGERSTLTRP